MPTCTVCGECFSPPEAMDAHMLTHTDRVAVKPKVEMVDHPSHYGGDTVYEVIKVLRAWGCYDNALRFNSIKYLARAGKKGDLLEDLKKARFYLNEEIKDVEEHRARLREAAPKRAG